MRRAFLCLSLALLLVPVTVLAQVPSGPDAHEALSSQYT